MIQFVLLILCFVTMLFFVYKGLSYSVQKSTKDTQNSLKILQLTKTNNDIASAEDVLTNQVNDFARLSADMTGYMLDFTKD